MSQDWKRLEEDICAHRAEIIDKLSEFSLNDVMLYLSPDEKVLAEQKEKWLPVLQWVNQALNAHFISDESLVGSEKNQQAMAQLKNYINTFSDKQLAAFYMAALNMRSVLLAIALLKGHINAAQAFELAELEELYQARRWGNDPAAEARRNSLKAALQDVEKYLKS